MTWPPLVTTLFLCSLPKLLRGAIYTHCVLISSSHSFFNPLQIRLLLPPLHWNCSWQSHQWPLNCKLSINSVISFQPSAAFETAVHPCHLEAFTFFDWFLWVPLSWVFHLTCSSHSPHLQSLSCLESFLFSPLVISSILQIQFSVVISCSHSWSHFPSISHTFHWS